MDDAKKRIESYLSPDHPWKELLQRFDCVRSTNDLAKDLAASGAPHGTVILADRQTGGRGRMGRSFHSPGGVGIYLSVILRPDCPPHRLMHLTCGAAVAGCDAILRAAGFRPGIKWINDLVWNGKKLAGILTELSPDPKTGKTAWAVVGIGINCSQKPEDFPPELRGIAASLSMVTGKPVDRELLTACLMEELARMDAALLPGKREIMARYRGNCITVGRQVSVHSFDTLRHGTAVAVGDDGALTVRFDDGHTEAVNAGEVSVRGIYGYV